MGNGQVNPRPPRCRGARLEIPRRESRQHRVSILAPRCRGARRYASLLCHLYSYRFNPRPPLPGGASLELLDGLRDAKVSILAPRCRGARQACCGRWRHRTDGVSILAPRCRGARRFARNRRKSRKNRCALREPALEPASVLPLVPQSACAVLTIQQLTGCAIPPAI